MMVRLVSLGRIDSPDPDVDTFHGVRSPSYVTTAVRFGNFQPGRGKWQV
jgi:hypothetical protein